MSEGQSQVNSPSKCLGRSGARRKQIPLNTPEENPISSRNPRKKTSTRKRVKRLKRRGQTRAKQSHEDSAAPVSPIGIRDSDLAECIYSDGEVCS